MELLCSKQNTGRPERYTHNQLYQKTAVIKKIKKNAVGQTEPSLAHSKTTWISISPLFLFQILMGRSEHSPQSSQQIRITCGTFPTCTCLSQNLDLPSWQDLIPKHVNFIQSLKQTSSRFKKNQRVLNPLIMTAVTLDKYPRNIYRTKTLHCTKSQHDGVLVYIGSKAKVPGFKLCLSYLPASLCIHFLCHETGLLTALLWGANQLMQIKDWYFALWQTFKNVNSLTQMCSQFLGSAWHGQLCFLAKLWPA